MLKQLEDERLALGRDTARWNSEIRKTSALIRPNETDSPAIARLADLQERIAHNETPDQHRAKRHQEDQ